MTRLEELPIILTNLYEAIIGTNSNAEKMRVISGYASPVFLRRVKRDYPSMKIELFIGMSQKGINKKNHDEYIGICKDFNDIDVYYQVSGNYTHRKIVEFNYINRQKVYIGSANFTENGFIKQKELMVNIHYNVNDLFVLQKEMSVKCQDERVPDLIPLYNEDLNSNVESEEEVDNTQEDLKSHLINGSIQRHANYQDNTFDIEIVFDSKFDPHWESNGINAWTDNKVPYLLQTPKQFFDTIFPRDSIFKIITNEFIFEARLQGDFYRELVILNGNIYEYVREKIGLIERRPITREDLLEYGNTKFRFTKVNDFLFEMIF